MKARLLLSILFVLAAPMVLAQSNVKQRLTNLFREAEQSYLIDDYQQLQKCMSQYADIFNEYEYQLSDSADVFRAYYYKMCGSYYYGMVGDERYAAEYAEEGYQQSLEIFERRKSTENVMKLHEELAQLYYKTGNYQEAVNNLNTVYAYYDKQLNELEIDSAEPDYYRTLSQLAMCNARKKLFSTALTQIDNAIRYYKKTKDERYYEAQRRKGKILMMQADSQRTGNYKEALKLYKEYVEEQYESIAQRLGSMNESQRAQHWLAIHQFLYDCSRLGNQAPDMLYDLALFSKGYLIAYENNKNVPRTSWRQVKKELNPTDCALEFVQYYDRNDKKRTGCLVLKSNSKVPQFVDLFSSDSVLNIHITLTQTIGSALTSTTTTLKNDLYQYKKLPQIIWTPQLMTAIGDAKRILFSPDGFLNTLAIEYLMPDSTKECYRLSSTRIIRKKRVAPNLDRALLCGGMTYNTSVSPYTRKNDAVAYRYLSPNVTYIKELPGAKEEVDSIRACRNQKQDELMTGRGATDEKFLMLLKQGFNVVHLSTHGFYNGEIGIYNDIKPLNTDQPMSKSGILFAGASETLTNKNFDDDLFDGVLSATELARQDFSKVELVVLSACQTALGHLTDDGVYGIQRALKQAGAQGLILSLWNVNDLAASRLMRYFYRNMEKQKVKNIHTAFMEARKQLLTEKETFWWQDPETLEHVHKTLNYGDPCYSNPFILIDIY